MFQELAAATGSTTAAIAVMLLVIALFGLLVWRLVRMGAAKAAARARLPLEDAPAAAEAGDRDGSDVGGRGPNTSTSTSTSTSTNDAGR